MKHFKKIIFAIIFAISIILISCGTESTIPKDDSPPIFSMRSTDPLVFDDKLWVLGGSGVDGSCNGATRNICYDVWSSSNGKDWSLEATSGLNFLEKEEEVRSNFYSIVFDKKITIFNFIPRTTDPTTEIWTSSDGKDWNQVTTDLNFNIKSKPLVVDNKIIARTFLRIYETPNLENWHEITSDLPGIGFFSKLYYHDQTYFVYDASYDSDDFNNRMLLGYNIYTSRDLSNWTKSGFFSFTLEAREFNIIDLDSKSYLFITDNFNQVHDIYTNDNPTTGNWRKLTRNRDFAFGRNIVYFKGKFFVIIRSNFNTENEVWSWDGDEDQDWQKIR